MAENYSILGTTLDGIAEAVRNKTGRNDPMYPTEFAEAIESISVGTNLEILEGVPVEVDFSDGDFDLSVPDGYAVKSATVLKPDTLKPENIAEGVNIAGIIGALAAGGGSGGTLVVKTGTFTTTNSNSFDLEHGLGVVPLAFGVSAKDMTSSGKVKDSQLYSAFSVSKEVCDLLGLEGFMQYSFYSSYTPNLRANSVTYANCYLDANPGGANSALRKATATSITVGSGSYNPASGATYHWIAIGIQ